MKMPLLSKAIAALLSCGSAGRLALPAMIVAAAASATLPAAASSFSVGGSGNNFTISRSGAGMNAAETVSYRTIGLSAYGGQHFVARSGTLVFAPGQGLAARRLGRDGGWEAFAPHIEKKSDEVAANLMVSLIRQCTYLLARQIAQLEADFKKHGGIKERMYAARSESRGEDWGKAAYSHLAAVQSPDELASRCREMTAELRRMADGIKRRKGWA